MASSEGSRRKNGRSSVRRMFALVMPACLELNLVKANSSFLKCFNISLTRRSLSRDSVISEGLGDNWAASDVEDEDVERTLRMDLRREEVALRMAMVKISGQSVGHENERQEAGQNGQDGAAETEAVRGRRQR